MTQSIEQQLLALDDWQDELVEQLVALSTINSGSLNADGVNRVGEALTPLYTQLGASAERIGVDDFVSTTDAGERSHCLLYTSPSPRDQRGSRMPSSA